MPLVRVTRTVTLMPTARFSITYVAGKTYLVPDHHIERLVAADAGVRLTRRGDYFKGSHDPRDRPADGGDDAARQPCAARDAGGDADL